MVQKRWRLYLQGVTGIMINYCTVIPRHNEPGTHYIDIYPSVMQVKMCIEPWTPIYQIDVTKTDNPTDSSYWAWEDPDGGIGLVYYAFFLLNMCFPCGSAAEEKAGRGKVIRVNIKTIEEVI